MGCKDGCKNGIIIWQEQGSGTLSVAKCPWKISIFGKWNNYPHPYPTLTHNVYLDGTLHVQSRAFWMHCIFHRTLWRKTDSVAHSLITKQTGIHTWWANLYLYKDVKKQLWKTVYLVITHGEGPSSGPILKPLECSNLNNQGFIESRRS